MLHRLHYRLRDPAATKPPPSVAVLDEDADEELLALLARDTEPQFHWPRPRYIPPMYHSDDRHRGVYRRSVAPRDTPPQEQRTSPPAKPYVPKPVPTWHGTWQEKGHFANNIEPWFLPDRALTQDDLKEIAFYALSYFASAMRTTQPGLTHVGGYMTQVSSARNADAIAGALYPLAKSLPPTARLSAVPLPLPDGTAGVALALRVGAVHLALPAGNQIVMMVFTYDA